MSAPCVRCGGFFASGPLPGFAFCPPCAEAEPTRSEREAPWEGAKKPRDACRARLIETCASHPHARVTAGRGLASVHGVALLVPGGLVFLGDAGRRFTVARGAVRGLGRSLGGVRVDLSSGEPVIVQSPYEQVERAILQHLGPVAS